MFFSGLGCTGGGAAAVALPIGVLKLDSHSSSEADPSKSSLPLVFVEPMVLHFCVQMIQKTTDADSSTPSRFVHPPLARTPRCCEAYLRWRSALLSTMYPPTTSESSAGDSSSESYDSISPEDSVEEDIDTDVLEDIKADATTVKVVVDRDVEVGIDAGIGMDVDVGIDVEDEVEDEVESSDRGTIEVGVDVVVGIGIPDAMLMFDVVKRLDQVASLERSKARLRGIMMKKRARAYRFRGYVRFMESEHRQIYRFRYYDNMRTRRLETFVVWHLAAQSSSAVALLCISSRNLSLLAMESCSGSGSHHCQWECLVHFIPNNPPLNLMLQLQSSFQNKKFTWRGCLQSSYCLGLLAILYIFKIRSFAILE
nr:hypothetical protein [Tanacetum cinerariifolium]